MITYQKHYSGDEYYYRDISLFNFSIVPHMHEYSELTYVKKGKIKVMLNNRIYILKEGDLLLITQNQIHSYDTIDNDEPEIIDSLTPGARQKNWKTPTEFLCCPKPEEIEGNPIDCYFKKLSKKVLFQKNKYED